MSRFFTSRSVNFRNADCREGILILLHPKIWRCRSIIASIPVNLGANTGFSLQLSALIVCKFLPGYNDRLNGPDHNAMEIL